MSSNCLRLSRFMYHLASTGHTRTSFMNILCSNRSHLLTVKIHGKLLHGDNPRTTGRVQHDYRMGNEEEGHRRYGKDHRNMKEDDLDLLKLSSPDTFGTLSKPEVLESEYLEDDDDGYDRLEKKKGIKSVEYYDDILAKLINRGGPDKVKKAMQVLEEMEHENRIFPEKYHYSLLITGCSHYGLVKQAFDLFQEMLKAYPKPTKAQVTALFNACAESADRNVALDKANYLREFLFRTSYVCNTLQYNSMIKAYGKLGEMKTAFEILKEMRENRITITDETYCMLLMGAISDKEAGFSHAIRIIRRMKKRNVPITVHAINLLLRCTRDCGLGSKEHLKSLIQAWKTSDVMSLPKNYEEKDDMKRITADSLVPIDTDVTINLLETDSKSKEYLDQQKLMERVISLDIDLLKYPQNRLQLLGGVDSICDLFRKEKIKPTIATLTTLLECFPTKHSENVLKLEEQLISFGDQMRVKFDTDFFNILMKRRCMRHDMAAVKSALLDMQNRGLLSNIMTFGVLAISCDNRKRGLQLIRDMNRAGLKINIEVAETLITCASYIPDFKYLMDILKLMSYRKLKPLPSTVEKIHVAVSKTSDILFKLEKKIIADVPEVYKKDGFSESFDTFKLFYKKWLRNNEIEFPQEFTKQFEFEMSPKPKTKYYEFEQMMRDKLKDARGES